MTADNLRVGWKDIATFLNMNERTIQRRREQLVNHGVVFFKHTNTTGSPYNACAFESKLKAWCAHKARQGEKI